MRRYARPMGRAFAVRGIVEGFYGKPVSYTHLTLPTILRV